MIEYFAGTDITQQWLSLDYSIVIIHVDLVSSTGFSYGQFSKPVGLYMPFPAILHNLPY